MVWGVGKSRNFNRWGGHFYKGPESIRRGSPAQFHKQAASSECFNPMLYIFVLDNSMKVYMY